MEKIRTIPTEMLNLIPKFDGDKRLLNLFIKRSEYVINIFQLEGNHDQDVYIFHAITSRLVREAAYVISEREDITTWAELKEVFTHLFGDTRSEECIAIELDNLRIKLGESYSAFCNRIQILRSTLFSKVNSHDNDHIKEERMAVYNHMSLNVFLYNLPADIVRAVRLQECDKLEDALSIVMKEVNFLSQYHSRNPNRQHFSQSMPNFMPFARQNYFGQNNKFGQQQNIDSTPTTFSQNKGFKIVESSSPSFNTGIPSHNQDYRHKEKNFVFGMPVPPVGTFTPTSNLFSTNNDSQPAHQLPNQPKFGVHLNHQQTQGDRPLHKDDNCVSIRTVFPEKNNNVAQRSSYTFIDSKK